MSRKQREPEPIFRRATPFEVPDLRKLLTSGGYDATVSREDGIVTFHIEPADGPDTGEDTRTEIVTYRLVVERLY